VPAGARDLPKASSRPARAAAQDTTSSFEQSGGSQRFKDRVAAIIADSSTVQGRAWSDVDRDRVVDQFRLPDPGQWQQVPKPAMRSLASRVIRDETTRGMTFGLDGGTANLGPPVDPAARAAEVVAYRLSEASTCNGLMPGVDCNTIGGDDVSVRLALAFNF
jgi:hypothetical protein